MRAQPEIKQPNFREIATLLRGEVNTVYTWNQSLDARRLLLQVIVIVVGAGCYGAAMGWWRDPQQALFTAVKFPLIILLTTAGNALINGMLAPLLGLNIPFRQSLSAIVMSFAVTSAIFGAFSPLVAFMVWNAPPMSTGRPGAFVYNCILLAQVLVIALAGTTGNLRLFQLLQKAGGSRAVAWRVTFAWLTANFFLGSQLSWMLRPFIGSPGLPVEFLRRNALEGNFYECVLRSLRYLFAD